MDETRFGELAAELGFKREGSAAWGERGGYLFALSSTDSGLVLRAAVDSGEEARKLTLDAWLSERKAAAAIADYADQDGSLTIVLPSDGLAWAGSTAFIDACAAKFAELGFKPACWSCNKAVEAPAAFAGVEVFALCEPCYGRAASGYESAMKERRIEVAPLALGFAGALLGALLGSVLWVAIGLAGFYASIAGFAIAWAAAKGYGLFKGRSNAVAPWLIGAAILIAATAAEATGLAIQIIKWGKEEGLELGILQGFRLLPSFLSDSEVLASIAPNFFLGLLFAGLGSWRLLRDIAKGASRSVLEIRRPAN